MANALRVDPKQPLSAAGMMAQLGPEYRDLLPLVQMRVPDQYKVVMAHRRHDGIARSSSSRLFRGRVQS